MKFFLRKNLRKRNNTRDEASESEVNIIKKANELPFRSDLLREGIRSAGLSQRKLADMIGIDEKTFSQKMNGESDWKLSEIKHLQRLLPNVDIYEIFLDDKRAERP